MTSWVGNHVIKEHTDLISETFVIFFIALSKNQLKGCDQRMHNFWMNCKLLNCFFASNFNQVPKCFNCQRHNVGSEIALLVNNSDEVSSNTQLDDLFSNWLKNADGSEGFQYRYHSIYWGSSAGVICQKENKSFWNLGCWQSFKVFRPVFEKSQHGRSIGITVNYFVFLSWL